MFFILFLLSLITVSCNSMDWREHNLRAGLVGAYNSTTRNNVEHYTVEDIAKILAVIEAEEKEAQEKKEREAASKKSCGIQ